MASRSALPPNRETGTVTSARLPRRSWMATPVGTSARPMGGTVRGASSTAKRSAAAEPAVAYSGAVNAVLRSSAGLSLA